MTKMHVGRERVKRRIEETKEREGRRKEKDRIEPMKSLRKLRKSDDADGKNKDGGGGGGGGNGSYNYRMFMMFKRKFKINEVEPPQDVKDVFSKFAEGSESMSADQFRKFLIEFQGDECGTVSDAELVVERILKRKHKEQDANGGVGGGFFNLDDFYGYLFFDDLNAPIRMQVHHDMSAPLQDYYIFTGHNSYLNGNQLSGVSSDIPIIKALLRGVRGIELDLWPNSTKDDIEVLHGRTLTTPVPLLRCLKSIKQHAFDSSPYPVIITLEDHLTPDLQAKVAEMVTLIFGKMLFYPESECLRDFPSPEELKHRVILSTKPPKEYIDSYGSKGSNNQSPNENDLEDEERALSELLVYEKCSGGEIKDDPDAITPNQEVQDCSTSNHKAPKADSAENIELISSPVSKNKYQQLEIPHYKTLNGLQAGKPKSDLKETLRVVPGSVKRLSLSEAALEKAAISHATDLVKFTQRNVLRIYPKGRRVTSSNYDPMVGWMHGAQMVAFNMQGYGKSLWLMQGMFRSNGGCGYIKKPGVLMSEGLNNEVFDPRITRPVQTTLHVKVYLGDGWRMDFSPTHFDMYSPPDFYTKVYIVGVPEDSVKKRTKIIDDDWCPVWDEEFTFPLTVPELALLRIEVREYDKSEKDDFGGQTCLPVSEVKSGIRSIPLFDKKGDQMKSVRLLMRFQFI